MKTFDFGQNWVDFSQRALTEVKVKASQDAFFALANGPESLKGKTLLDIGCGQGLSALAAASAGARVLAIDINPKSLEATRMNAERFYPNLSEDQLETLESSIIDENHLEDLKTRGPFDLVHSWGVLHHTGNMALALENSASLVAPGGRYIIAIYQKHWSSLPWRWIKASYNVLPTWGRRVMVALFQPVIWVAARLTSGQNPSDKERGMDFRTDIIDWLGGYPYEFASTESITSQVEALGFKTEQIIPPRTPTGCVEYVFQSIKVLENDFPDPWSR